MATRATASVTLAWSAGIVATVRYYQLAAPTAATPAVPASSSGLGSWSEAEPAADVTKVLWTCERTVYADGTESWSKASRSTSYEAAKDAKSTAADAQSKAAALSTLIRQTDAGVEVGKSADGKAYTTNRALMSSSGAFQVLDKAGGVLANFDEDSVDLGGESSSVTMLGGKCRFRAHRYGVEGHEGTYAAFVEGDSIECRAYGGGGDTCFVASASVSDPSDRSTMGYETEVQVVPGAVALAYNDGDRLAGMYSFGTGGVEATLDSGWSARVNGASLSVMRSDRLYHNETPSMSSGADLSGDVTSYDCLDVYLKTNDGTRAHTRVAHPAVGDCFNVTVADTDGTSMWFKSKTFEIKSATRIDTKGAPWARAQANLWDKSYGGVEGSDVIAITEVIGWRYLSGRPW